jgi:uncharacterized protein involved in propanediol utilization
MNLTQIEREAQAEVKMLSAGKTLNEVRDATKEACKDALKIRKIADASAAYRQHVLASQWLRELARIRCDLALRRRK